MEGPVYGKYTQEALDLRYEMRRRCPHFAETFATMEVHNQRMVERHECRIDAGRITVKYGRDYDRPKPQSRTTQLVKRD